MNYHHILTALLFVCAGLAITPKAEAYYRRSYGYHNYSTGGWGASRTSYNSYTNRYSHGAAGYNPYTGREGATRSYTNPYTGRSGQAAAVYNPYTNRYAYGVHRD